MNWVLILIPSRRGDDPIWPAVIGGYRTREEADAAGRSATAADDEEFGPEWCARCFERYAIIPGAADTAPSCEIPDFASPR